MSLLFNVLSRLVITFLPRSKHLLISWLQSPSAVILEPPKIKSATVSTISPSICHEVMGLDAMILLFWMFFWMLKFPSSSPYILMRKIWGTPINCTTTSEQIHSGKSICFFPPKIYTHTHMHAHTSGNQHSLLFSPYSHSKPLLK